MTNKALWLLAAWKYTNGAFKIVAMGLQSAFAVTWWNSMTPGQKFLIVVSICVQLGTYTDSFIDTTAAKLAAGKPPVGTNGTGNTQIFTNPSPPEPNKQETK